MPKLEVNDTQIHVIDRGAAAAPTVLFVHGFPLDHSMWQAQLDEFAEDYRVVAPDLRGFGRSGVSPGTVRMEQFADDLAALLDALGIAEPVVLCGLSMGGYIAWQFARRHGRRLRALILCDTRAAADSPANAAARLELANAVLAKGSLAVITPMLPKLLAQRTRAERPDIVERLKTVIAATHPEGIAAALRGMAERPDSTPLLSEVRLPALLAGGREDTLTPVDEMRGMADQMPDARFVEIPEAGHMAPMENPVAVNRAIRDFLQSI